MNKLLIALLAVVAACNTTANTKQDTVMKPISSADSTQPKTITVQKDSTFTIQLLCSAGQGFSWKFADSSFKNIQYLRQEFSAQPNGKDGSDGIQTFYFKATTAGNETVSFIYLQPFVKPTPADAPVKKVTIQILNN